MHRLIFMAILFLAGPAFALSDFETRVSGYLLAGGKDPQLLKSQDAYALVVRAGGMEIGRWDADAIGLPEPAEADLPVLADALALVNSNDTAQAALADAAWAVSEDFARVQYRNGVAADIQSIAAAMAALAGDPTLAAYPVPWIRLSTYMRENRTNALVQAAALELNSLALFYTSWGGDLFAVALESTNRPASFQP